MSATIKILILSLALVSVAHAQDNDDTKGSTDGKGDQVMIRQLGVGGAYGSYGGSNQGAVSIQSNNAQIGNSSVDGPGGDGRTYAFGKSNLDIGPGGISAGGEIHMGKNFWSRDNNESIVPLFGLEPLNFMGATSIGFDSQPGGSLIHRAVGHTPYLEYTPMVSLGAQVFTDSCQAMFMIRGGGVIGTMGGGPNSVVGFGGAYGVGASAVCKDLLMVNADLTRIVTPYQVMDKASFMAGVKIPGSSWSIGVDFDGQSVKDISQAAAVYSLPVQPGPTTEMTVKGVVGAVF